MSTQPGANLVKWYPPVDDNPTPAQSALHLRLLYNGSNDHDQAITTLKTQFDTLNATVQATSTTTNTGKTITITDIAGFASLAAVNNQTGVTAYTVQSGDNGSLVVLSDASPIAVTLNSVVTRPYFVFFANQGVGLVTMTASSGAINGASTIPGNSSAIVFFDGTNWWTWAILTPQSAAAVTHQWLKSYNAATGTFTQTQPAYSDISGTPVLPATIAPIASQYLTGYTAGTGTFTQALAVASFNGRTGVVVPVAGDYTAAQVTNAADVTAANTTFVGNLKVNSSFALWASVIRDTVGAAVMTTLSGRATFPNLLTLTGGESNAVAQTGVSGSGSGLVTFSQPQQGSSWKKVIIFLSAVTGTASYTFPAGFTHTPVIVTTNGPAAAIVTALSTTAVTVTGSATTGIIILEGF